MGAPEPTGYRALVRRRAAREPLPHITGTAPFRDLELAVSPGVFVPRPETELLVQLALDAARLWREAGETRPAVID
ncbi:peptide chain release factor N(5)-glutamine methyltransferase, partial [Kocuria rhizophila]